MPDVLKQINKLVELQKIDADIYNFKRELKEKPNHLQELKEQFENKKANLKELENKYKNLQVERNSQELELKAKEEAIAKANVQLSQIKTNREYTAKLTEIENIKADRSVIEEKILLTYDETDILKAEIDKEKEILKKEEEKFSQEKTKIEDSIKEIEDRIRLLESQRKQITPEIDKTHLIRYERILINKDGWAIVPVKSGACGGCFMNVPAQVINEIKMHQGLVFCEMCARILYLEEDL